VCRRELEAQRALQAALSTLPPDPEVTLALARMHQRMDTAARGPWHRLTQRFWHGSHPLLRGALALQLIAILGLAAALVVRAPPAYHTLSADPAVAQARTGIAITFSDGLSEKEVRTLLTGLALRIVDGPTADGAYTLAVEAQRREAAMLALRGHPAVKLALPVNLPQESGQ
jgi:hypothetical protein